MDKLVLKKTPIRSNLKFSPSPDQPESTAKKTASKQKKLSPTTKRKSIGVPIKIKPPRRGVRASARTKKAPIEGEENISDSTFVVKRKPEEKPKEASDIEEEEQEEDEEQEDEAPPPKAKRARAASSKPPAKPPANKPAPRSRKAKEVKESKKAPKASPVKQAPTPRKSSSPKSKNTPSKPHATPSKSNPTPSKSKPSPQTPMEFKNLKISHVIDDSISSKTITFQGTYNGEVAVIRLEKTLFDEAAMKKALGNDETSSTLDFANDVYSSYLLNPCGGPNLLNDIKATVICPANETVLAKYSRADMIFYSETPDTYLKVVGPFIEDKVTNEKDYNQWVFNILDGKAEADRIILNDPDPDSGFVIAPNLKSTGDEQDIRLVAICHRRDIRSLRDLNDEHLILLKNILTKGTKAIKAKYKKSKGHLRSYVHYHPSFYHFHVHFRMVDPSDYESSDRDNLLSTIINNISLQKDYYQKSTLTYPLSKNTALYQKLKSAKRF